tara:strand:- start:46 stop:159 length:114 start_codon:yes stop_codon:yes gene_type:complete
MPIPIWIKILAGICIFIAIAMMWFFREEFDNDDISDY